MTRKTPARLPQPRCSSSWSARKASPSRPQSNSHHASATAAHHGGIPPVSPAVSHTQTSLFSHISDAGQAATFLSRLRQQLGKTQLVPIGISQMEIPLSPGAILRWGRRATGREHGLIERIDIVNAKDCAAPPGREIVRREGQIDEGMPSLEGTEARLWPAIDQREAEFTIESNGLGHGPYCKGHGTDVVDHRHCVDSYEQLCVST